MNHLRAALLVLAVLALASPPARAADSRPLSPRGTAATEVGGTWQNPNDEDKRHYDGGKWIEVDYGRPILRGRANILGSGADTGKTVNAGAPVWRVGANATTKLKTELALDFSGKKIAPGEYDLFVDLQASGWTLIVSTQKSTDHYNPKDKSKIWGAYGYDPKFDVARIPMTVTTVPTSLDQLTIQFEDIADHGGNLVIAWDKSRALAPFKF